MANKTLGQMIGVVKHTLSTRVSDGTSQQATITIDFTNTSNIDIKAWLCANRGISGQRAWAKMSAGEYIANVNGNVFMANAIGQKVKTHEEKVALLRDTMSSLGYGEDQIELACNNVDRFIEGLSKEYPNSAARKLDK